LRLSEPGDDISASPVPSKVCRLAARDIKRLLSRAYRAQLPLERLMAGPTTVASALNANDPGLARIAAVHLRIRDLPSLTARDDMEAADIVIKSVDWNPALHPRTGTPPIPAGSR
jgi:hypothetical protein